MPAYKDKNRKVNYKKVSFKLTEKQKDLVDRCSRLKNTTPNKLIKAAIREYLDKHADMLEQDSYVTDNQLVLFSPKNIGEQMTMFEKAEKEEADKK